MNADKTLNSEKTQNYIIFLGTGGARFVVTKQLRSTGGIWFSLNRVNFLVDPGPGSLLRIVNSKHKLDPVSLRAILLSHKHIDHSNDVNIMIEAMTAGGTKKRGVLFCPEDALLGEERVILPYLKNYLEEIIILKAGASYQLNGIKFHTPIKHRHPGEVYGFLFEVPKESTAYYKIAYVADTKFMPEIATVYKAQLMIFNVIKLEPSELEHLSLNDVRLIVKEAKPQIVILTHFGMTMLRAQPHLLAQSLKEELKTEVIAAYDGMKFVLDF
jgi:ribonuclease BN (tRNA processing enzyme)